MTFRAIATVKELQENPRRGEFRIHAALWQQGIFLSPRTCGRISRALRGRAPGSRAARAEAAPLPCHPAARVLVLR